MFWKLFLMRNIMMENSLNLSMEKQKPIELIEFVKILIILDI